MTQKASDKNAGSQTTMLDKNGRLEVWQNGVTGESEPFYTLHMENGRLPQFQVRITAVPEETPAGGSITQMFIGVAIAGTIFWAAVVLAAYLMGRAA